MPIVVPIVSDTSGLTRGLRGAGSNLAKFGKIAALAIGVGVTAELYKSVKAAAAAEKSTQALRGQLETLGKSDDVQRLQDQFTQLATTLGVDDEAASRAFTSILRLTGDSTKAMEGLNLALDLSANTGFADLEKNAMQVARAMNGNTRLFKQFGIVVDETTSKEEALAIVQGRVQGQAESFGASATGSFQRFNEAVENLRENIGGPLVVALAAVAGKVAAFVNTFREQPTLEAKIRLVVGTIGNIAWQGIRSLYAWWDTQGRVELPARVILIPSGRKQFDDFFTSLEMDARAAGKRMGVAAISALVGIFSSEGRSKIGSSAKSFADSFTNAAEIFFRITGTTLITNLIGGMLEAIPEMVGKIGPALRDALLSSIKDATKALPTPIRGAVEDAFGAASGRKLNRKDNIITATVKAAIQDARKQLQSFGSSLVAFMSQKRSALFRLAGGSNAAEITAEQRRIEDERFTIAEKAARDALALAEDKTEAQLDLDQLLLDRGTTLRDRALQDAEDSDKKTIDNLIEQFNRGLISAESFSTQLTALIGSDFGTELGIGFAGAFSRELQSVLALVADIQKVAGAGSPITSEAPGVSNVQKEENTRRYNEALAKHTAARAARLKAAQDFRKRAGSAGGERITTAEAAEIREIMKDWDASNQKPQRSAFGLARGGILKQPTFVAGEAGREAVIPLESSSAMKILRDAIGGGGGSTVVYNLVVNAGLGTDPDDLSRTIVESIKRYEKRNGAVFQGPIVTTLANAAGKTSTASAATDFNRAKTLRSG
jgi:hypothetical protein